MTEKTLFNTGRVVMTIGIKETIKEDPAYTDVLLECIARHVAGDWGDMPEEDKAMNDNALASGDDRIFSGYNTNHGKIWIITEWDRSYTTILYPSEY